MQAKTWQCPLCRGTSRGSMHYSDVQDMTGKRMKYFIVKYAHTVGFRRVAMQMMVQLGRRPAAPCTQLDIGVNTCLGIALPSFCWHWKLTKTASFPKLPQLDSPPCDLTSVFGRICLNWLPVRCKSATWHSEHENCQFRFYLQRAFLHVRMKSNHEKKK